jgi:acetylornithine deacetylase/succinyl-diaminopimelate desuccinylase-like protein
MNSNQTTIDRVRPFIRRQRLIETAVAIIAVPSPTGEAGAVSDRLAEILSADGFRVERPAGGYDPAPAVAIRFDTGRPGRTLQFNGHLDTVHLPFVAPKVEARRITGSGASDMKSGIAAAIEAVRALRDSKILSRGSVLLTAHDLHESPWGDGRQLEAMIRAGYVGDAVLLPEPLRDRLPVAGRGLAVWKVAVSRPGAPVHEVMRPTGEPSVISAAAALVAELDKLATVLISTSADIKAGSGVHAGDPSVFVGQIHAGEIFNQFPQVCHLEGTRRWLPGTDRHEVERDFRALLGRVAAATGTTVNCDWIFTRDAFFLDAADALVAAFQDAHAALSGRPLALGPKPFVDDGNTFWALAGKPAITHGPEAGGQHTLHEWVSIDDLERVALQYAATAVAYCGGGEEAA